MMQNYKRLYSSTGDTPYKPEKKRGKNSCFARKSLTFSCGSPTKKTEYLKSKSPVKYHLWSYEEERSLVEFASIARTDPSYNWCNSEVEWPSFRQDHKFWEDGAKHIRESTGANFLLTNNRVRCRLLNKIRSQYKTILEAEQFYNLSSYDQEIEIDETTPKYVRNSCNGVNKTTQTTSTQESEHVSECKELPVDVLAEIKKLVKRLSDNDLLTLANEIFCQLCNTRRIDSSIGDFITLSLQAMKFLQDNGKLNLLYKFAYGLAKKRPGSDEESLFPINRMPFGLVAYQIDFFSCTNIQQISVPADFALWHETLCSEFPTRFNRIFRGPMWSSVPVNQQKNPLKALVNVACPSTRTVQKRASQSEFSNKPELQVAALKQLKEAHPNGRFWIKVDACDIKPALQESTKGEWNGDCYSNNLEELRLSYKKQQSLLLLHDGDKEEKVKSSISALVACIKSDITFLAIGLKNANAEYTAKFNVPTTSKETLKSLCWEIVEFNTLLQQAQSISATLEMLLSKLSSGSKSRADDVIKATRNAKPDLLKYFRNVYIKRRQPAATHILVFLISEERRRNKPYAIPVQYIPYNSIKDQYIRDMSNKIKEVMVSMEMKPVGCVSDGEFSSLRTRGETRALHIWQLIHDVKESVRRQSEATLLSMLVKIGEDANGLPLVACNDRYIPSSIIEDLHNLRLDQGLSLEDSITYLRGKLVPNGYSAYPFRANAPESQLDKLRSLVATYRFRGVVAEYKTSGIDFSLYLYVPETDLITGEEFHEREDHCHLLKRIWKQTREGGPPWMDLKGFDEAMMDPNTGLTQAALTGERKQSVQDAERMLSFLVADFLQSKDYDKEAKFIRTVAGWHEAADGRGLSEIERSKRNYTMLNMILDDWMPWHNTVYDLSKIDINRPIKGICGFSRETVIGVTTNIESLEFRRRQIKAISYEEHPRASATDDVEAFFALVHRFLGSTFTLKQFKYVWRKLVREFCKRMNPDLPFYFWSLNERYRDIANDLPSFNIHPGADDDGDDDDDDDNPQRHPLRLHRLTINRREDSSIFVPGRSFLPSRNATTVRQRLFRPTSSLPSCPRVERRG